MIIYGERGAEKMILSNLPCMHCDFIADDPIALGHHLQQEHFIPFFWSSINSENLFYKIGKQDSDDNHKGCVKN